MSRDALGRRRWTGLSRGDPLARQAGASTDSAISPVVLLVAAGFVLLQLLTAGNYGIFRDELYYLACADHLSWGYVDHPPLSIFLLWIERVFLGDSVVALRVLPALAGAGIIVLAADMVRQMGGGRYAQMLAAVAVVAAPAYLGLTGYYSMNALDLLFWALAVAVVIRLINTDNPRLWLVFGLVAGLGLLNKISVLFLGFGLAVALILTPLRRHLTSRYLWMGGGLAALIFLPHILWQIRYGWPTLEFIHNAAAYKNARLTPLEFMSAQVLDMHPLNAPIWLAGLGVLLFGREGRRYRALGVIFLAVLALLVLQNSKPYYLAPAFVWLMAAGAIAFERLLARRPWTLLRPALIVLLLAGGAALAPFAIPVLPVESFIAYQRALGLAPPQEENNELGPLPQHYADHFGWAEMAQAVATVYQSLPASERQNTLIVGSNYGEAGAINYFGPKLGLPAAVSQHNSFYLWGPGRDHVDVVITIGMSPADLEGVFDSVTVAAQLSHPYAMPYENRDPILVCRGLRMPLDQAWRAGKHFQ